MIENQANSEECNSFGSASDGDNEELTDNDLVTLGLKVADMEHFNTEREKHVANNPLKYGMKCVITK